MATFVDSAAAVEVSKPETVEMEVAKDVEDVDAAKGLKRKLEEAAADDAVKTNGTATEEGKNGHGEAKNGTNGNHVEVKDSPVKKAKTEEETPEVTEKVEETVEKESTEKAEENVEEAKIETPTTEAEVVPAAIVESTDEKESKTDETAVTTTESSVKDETEGEKVAETAEADAAVAVVADEKKEEPSAEAEAAVTTTPVTVPDEPVTVTTDSEEKAAE